jgi:hypothetical protein
LVGSCSSFLRFTPVKSFLSFIWGGVESRDSSSLSPSDASRAAIPLPLLEKQEYRPARRRSRFLRQRPTKTLNSMDTPKKKRNKNQTIRNLWTYPKINARKKSE